MVRRGGGNLSLVVDPRRCSFSSPTSPRRRRAPSSSSGDVGIAARRRRAPGTRQIVAAALAPPARLRRTHAAAEGGARGFVPARVFSVFSGGGAAAERAGGAEDVPHLARDPVSRWGRVRGGVDRRGRRLTPRLAFLQETLRLRGRRKGGARARVRVEAREGGGGTSRARTGEGGGGAVVGCDPGRAPKRAPGRDSSAPGAPRGGRTALLLGESARLGLFPNFRRRRFVSATRWRRARSRASIIIPPLGPADVGERSARAVARKSGAGTDARARSKINGGARVMRRRALRPPPASLVTGRSLRVHAAARCAPARANRARLSSRGSS